MPRSRSFSYKPNYYPPPRPPGAQRAKALEYIKTQIANGREFPSSTALCAYMGWVNHQAVRSCLEGLRDDGHIECVGRTARNALIWRLRAESDTVAEKEAGSCATSHAADATEAG